MRQFFFKHIESIIIALTVLVIAFFNIIPHAYLTGWDNLQTELHPLLAIKRAIFSSWQEYQSFGLVSGMAHAADLVRAVGMGAISVFLPEWLERYVFHLAMLCVGSIGAMKFLRRLFGDQERWSTLAGALFYMLNFGTIQIFHLPFEPFSAFFASLPWLLLSLYDFLNSHKFNKKSTLLFLVVVNFLATPSYYLQTLFVVYGLMASALSIGIILNKKQERLAVIKKIILAAAVILTINLFWILPQVYFLKTNGNVVRNAKINQLTTEDVAIQNQAKGTPMSFLKLEGFYYDLQAGSNTMLFEIWRQHFKIPLITFVQFGFIALFVLGLFSKQKHKKTFLIMLGICGVILLSNAPIVRILNQIALSPTIIGQMFRSPFTKTIVAFALVYSYFITAGLIFLKQKLKLKNEFVASIALVCVILYSYPILNGHFFSYTMRVIIPQQYHDVVDYFKDKDKNKRIALLPEYTFWGWYNYRWGYNGSGFLWYGIEQPIVSRTFDVWNKKSESYYWEMKAALEKEDIVDIERIVTKYDVDYLLLDASVLPVSGTYRALQYDRLIELLQSSLRLKIAQQWKDITLFAVVAKHNNFVYSFDDKLSRVGPEIDITNDDSTRLFFTDWSTDESAPDELDMHLPFRNLFSQTRLPNKKWNIYESDKTFLVTAPLPKNPANFDFIYPDNTSYTAYLDGYETQQPISTSLFVDTFKGRFVANVEKSLITKVDVKNTGVYPCEMDRGETQTKASKLGFEIKSIDGALTCFGYDLPQLNQRYSYLVKIKNKNIAGRRLFFYILDKTKQQAYLEERLIDDNGYFIIAPHFEYGSGYSIVFQNTSYMNIPAENILTDLEIYLLPYDDIKSIRAIAKNAFINQRPTLNSPIVAEKLNYFTYEVTPQSTSLQTVVLSQSYDRGWVAFKTGDGLWEKIPKHLIVNSWSNGWSFDLSQDKECVNNGCKIVIIFWPQYLEFLGFGVLLITAITIFVKRERHRLNHTPIVIE